MMLISLAIALSAVNSQTLNPKDIIGAWGYGPVESRTIMINTDKIFSVAKYDLPGKKFIISYGGTWRLEGNRIIKNTNY